VRASVGFNNFHRDFFNALQAVDVGAITMALWHFVGVVVFYVVCMGSNVYLTGMLTLRWRRWLTKTYLNKWTQNHHYFYGEMLHRDLDNPDQRISEDLQRFSASTLSLFQQFLHALLMMFTFSIILWHLSKDFSFSVGHTQIAIPGFFYFAAFFYAILGTYLISWMGKLLPYLEHKNQHYNADFRFELVKMRQPKEEGGVLLDQSQFKGLFGRIYDNVSDIVMLKTRLMFFTKGYSFLSFIVGYLISMPLFLAKKMQLGGVMQTSSAFNSVVSAFSFFVESFNDLADWRSVIYRLAAFDQLIETKKTQIPLAEEAPCV